MSTTLAFDTLAYAKKLQKVGVPAEQAEVQAETLADVLESNMATKRDIADFSRDLKEMDVRITIRLSGLMMVGIGALAVLIKVLWRSFSKKIICLP